MDDPLIEKLNELVARGDTSAIYQIAMIHGAQASAVLHDGEKNHEISIQFARQGAALSHASSAMFLGHRLSVEEFESFDPAGAFEAYQQCLDLNPEDGYSHFLVGKCYEDGLGTAVDLQRAIECYEDAAERENRDGMYALARCYENGKGVLPDHIKARYWQEKGDADFEKNSKRPPT